MLATSRGYLGEKIRRVYRRYAPPHTHHAIPRRMGRAYQPTTVDRQYRYSYVKLARARASG